MLNLSVAVTVKDAGLPFILNSAEIIIGTYNIKILI